MAPSRDKSRGRAEVLQLFRGALWSSATPSNQAVPPFKPTADVGLLSLTEVRVGGATQGRARAAASQRRGRRARGGASPCFCFAFVACFPSDPSADTSCVQRPYGTRRAAVRRKRSNSSSSLNSLDFLMPESDEEAVVASACRPSPFREIADPTAPSPAGSDEPKKAVTDFGQKWSAKDDALLRRLGPRPNGETWLQIAEYFPARTIRGVKRRWQNLIKRASPSFPGPGTFR